MEVFVVTSLVALIGFCAGVFFSEHLDERARGNTDESQMNLVVSTLFVAAALSLCFIIGLEHPG